MIKLCLNYTKLLKINIRLNNIDYILKISFIFIILLKVFYNYNYTLYYKIFYCQILF